MRPSASAADRASQPCWRQSNHERKLDEKLTTKEKEEKEKKEKKEKRKKEKKGKKGKKRKKEKKEKKRRSEERRGGKECA